MRRLALTLLLTVVTVTVLSAPKKGKKMNPWPPEVKEIEYPSSADDTMQPAMFYAPTTDEPIPLLVALHTWSGNYKQAGGAGCANWCVKQKWAFIQPDFRGPNWTPQAMGSELVVKDIISAVDYVRKHVKIDPDRIYLIGGSGGGYGALLMAGRAPEIWAGVSAWCPISDLKKWHAECEKAKRGYYKHIEKAVEGIPGQDAKADEECRKRSANTYLKNAKAVNLDIATGIHDGHTGSVPISHTLEAFNVVADPKDQIASEDIEYFVEKEETPPALKKESGGKLQNRLIHFRRTSNNVRVTIFEGGHNILHRPGLNWLEHQMKGEPAVWNVKKSQTKVNYSEEDSQLAK